MEKFTMPTDRELKIKYPKMNKEEISRLKECICPGCGIMFCDNFHFKDCPMIVESV